MFNNIKLHVENDVSHVPLGISQTYYSGLSVLLPLVNVIVGNRTTSSVSINLMDVTYVLKVEKIVDVSWQNDQNIPAERLFLCLREAYFLHLPRIELVAIFISHKIFPVNCSNHSSY